MINLSPRYLSFILRSLPNFLWPLQWFIIKKSFKKTGVNFKFGYNSQFYDHRLIEIGDNVFMGLNTVINTNVPIIINNNVMFGRGVVIMGGDHNIGVVGKSMRFVKTGGKNSSITIEKDVWVGSNVLILKGVIIGEGAVIGAGSVVVKSIPPYTVSVGNPCKPIKLRFNGDDLKLHLKEINSNYTVKEVMELFNKYN
jgi:acetyltransferase-like isoleucine patch superfamily enzyme